MRFEKLQIRLFGDVWISELCTLKRERVEENICSSIKNFHDRQKCIGLLRYSQLLFEAWWVPKVLDLTVLCLTVAFVKVCVVAGRSRTTESQATSSTTDHLVFINGPQTAMYNAQLIWTATVLCCDLEKSFSKGSVVALFEYSRTPVLYVWISRYRTFKFTLTAVWCLDWMHPQGALRNTSRDGTV